MADFVGNYLPVLGTQCINHTGAPSSSDNVSFALYDRIDVVITCAAWAAGTAAVTFTQDTSTTATGDVKALEVDWQWTNVADTTSPLFTQTAVVGDTFDLSAADAIHVIPFVAEDLDVSGGFHALRVEVATPGVNADFYGVQFLCYNPRYRGLIMQDPTDNV